MKSMETLEPDEKWTTQRLQTLRDDGVPEDFRLDYKSKDALPHRQLESKAKSLKKIEMGKDATAFANSGGGVLIYGIREKILNDGRPIPSEFDPVSMADISRDQITQIIAANSEPTLQGVRVLPVPAPGINDPAQVCYIVIVPQSNTAHMASDGRFYFRNEATTGVMKGWQVRDAMSRVSTPKFSVSGTRKIDFGQGEHPRIEVEIAICNDSPSFAQFLRISVNWPATIGGHLFEIETWFTGEAPRSGASLGLTRSKTFLLTHNEVGPIFPGQTILLHARLKIRAACLEFSDEKKLIPEKVLVEIFADKMPKHHQELSLSALGPMQ